jgi:hypothetical protein
MSVFRRSRHAWPTSEGSSWRRRRQPRSERVRRIVKDRFGNMLIVLSAAKIAPTAAAPAALPDAAAWLYHPANRAAFWATHADGCEWCICDGEVMGRQSWWLTPRRGELRCPRRAPCCSLSRAQDGRSAHHVVRHIRRRVSDAFSAHPERRRGPWAAGSAEG